MKITNTTGLPDAIVEAVRNDDYSKGDADISVTALIGPPRKAALEDQHGDEIEEDASSRIWSLMGQAIHTILERANRKGIAERRLSIEVEGWKISGGMDLYDEDGVLVDYKTTSAWSVKGGAKDEWTQQLNCYAEILRSNGHPVKGLKIVAILRDWSKLEAARSPDYPQSQVVSFEIPLWDAQAASKFIRERVILHKQARLSWAVVDQHGNAPMDGLSLEEAKSEIEAAKKMEFFANSKLHLEFRPPLCTPEERWEKPGVYALMKQGQKKAVKLYDNEADAKSHASTSPALYVHFRPGEATRCRFYCSVAKFCSQANPIASDEAKESEALGEVS